MLQRISSIRQRRYSIFVRTVCAAGLAALLTATVALAARQRIEGVTNFGRITENLYRGGSVTSTGLRNLHDMGVRTVIDLAGKSGERDRCQRLGIAYHSFPMDADERPNPDAVERVLQIMSEADEPVYVHCSAGKHRAGTIAALYRIQIQGWAPERAWAEQQSYGFGSAKEHRKLYEFVYGSSGPASRSVNPNRD